ncbi:glycoside hydrolase family 97 catalytic domain-containing protein [Halobium salinum]|uniref:Glycoside hydrolase family 97 catalytic domain-containing protein n=1 Tax=Halobium salinum TaxID=1364940 RepID=A0ABD5PF87_9EURY|nr:glycoside hydrolase family 97 catalytic domain-containing protein [Halobium salinum]
MARNDEPFLKQSRRGFLGGLSGVLAAAAFSRDVSAEDASVVVNDEDAPTRTVTSPDGTVAVTVDVSDGRPSYDLTFDGRTLVRSSALGFDFRRQPAFGATAGSGTVAPVGVTGSESGVETERWTPVWDQYDRVSEDYSYLRLGLEETASPGRRGTLELRVFDDGLGFRFWFTEDFGASDDRFVVTSENTEFDFAGDYTSWWIENRFAQPDGEPGRFEAEYQETPLSEIPSGTEPQIPSGTPTKEGAHTPLTMRAAEDAYLSVHEADLVDYATLSLSPQSAGSTTFSATLAPLPDGTKVSARAPHVTPWRTIQLGRDPGDLVESSLLPLLNDDLDTSVLPTVGGEPSTDWAQPKKYLGIWWLMIAGSANWEYKTDAEVRAAGGNPAQYIHGAKTERMKRYMSFASQQNIDSVLVEGWNEGWDTYPGDGSGFDFSVDGSTPDFDVPAVTDYGQSLDTPVEMTIHNETAGNAVNYEEQILEDDIFEGYEENHIRSIKNGYVSNQGLNVRGDVAPDTNQHSQLAVNHHELVTKEATANRQLLERHEAVKPTGRRRQYPSLAAAEVVKAQEYDGFGALGSDVDFDHHVTLPFTRMLAGPMSYQPGIFDITFNDSTGGRIVTTRAKQLAMYPNYFAGIQMAADRLEAYISPEFEVGQCLQAQAGELDGFITADVWRNAFGAHYVPVDPNRVASGSSVSYTVRDVPAAGEYDLHLRYASAPEENSPRVVEAGGPEFTLRVNDETRTVAPEFTSYWDDWQVYTTSVTLDAGDNEVAIELDYDDEGEFTGDVGGLNVNTVAVTETGEPSPVPAAYEGYTPENENFDAEPEFAFISDVPAGGWDDTSVLSAAIGDYVVTARRKDDEWFVGAMTDEFGRALDVPLDFLAPDRGGDDRPGEGQGPPDSPGKRNGTPTGNGNGTPEGNRKPRGKSGANGDAGPPSDGGPPEHAGRPERAGPPEDAGPSDGRVPSGPKYVAEIYSDGLDGASERNLTDVRIDEAVVDPSTTLLASMVRGGGTAVRIRPPESGEVDDLPEYERPTQEFDVDIDGEAFVQEPFVTATGSNDSDFVGGTDVEILVDGEVEAEQNVRLPPNADDVTVEFDFAIDSPGEYRVAVRRASGGTLASRTVTITPPATVATLSDPAGDDFGPGEYTYPTDGAFRPGAFDLRSTEVKETASLLQFTLEVDTLYNTFGGTNGFSPHMFVVWVRDPTKAGGSTESLDDLGANVTFEKPWHYRLRVDGFNVDLVNSAGGAVTDDEGNRVTPRVAADTEAGTVTLTFDRSAFGDVETTALEAIPMVQSEDFGGLRAVDVEASGFVFGGAKAGAVGNAPRIMDLATPEDVSQSAALAYDAEALASLPFVPLDGN